MTKSSYENVKAGYDMFRAMFAAIKDDEIDGAFPNSFYAGTVNHISLTMIIEDFVKSLPENKEFYKLEIIKLFVCLSYEIEGYLLSNPNHIYKSNIQEFHRNLVFIVDAIFEMTGATEDEILITTGRSESMTPIEKLLAWHYLAPDSLRLYRYNLKSGVFFLSRLLGINPESIKKPLSKLDDYTANKELSESQARSLYPILQRVKDFFDESDLPKISATVEARITELKIKSGKI